MAVPQNVHEVSDRKLTNSLCSCWTWMLSIFPQILVFKSVAFCFITCIIVSCHLILNTRDTYFSFANHWRPFYLHCRMCGVRYDAFVHLENISKEAPFVLKKMAGKMSTPPKNNVSIWKTIPVKL